MAPTATTSTASGTPTAGPIASTPTLSSGFAGEEFINNLGSDLAPLLTLFGEQVTKQFLSMSLGWADHILLAVGPLGIITTVVSAIRVSNVRVLKAIIGRAREKLATAELELLSSTSDATSELWTEEGIVRQPGHATILEMVAYKIKSTKMSSSQDETELEALSDTRMGDLSEAYNTGVLSPACRSKRLKALIGKFEQKFWSVFSTSSQSEALKDLGTMHAEIVTMNAEIARKEIDMDMRAETAEIALLTERTGSDAWSELQDRRDENIGRAREELKDIIAEKDAMIDLAQRHVRKLANQPPNLILNVHNTFPKSGELWTFVMIGMTLQFVAVAIPAIMTYHWREPRGSNSVQDYAYPTFLLGTCLLMVSIALCSYIIEATTVEQVFIPTDDYEVENILRVQLQQSMGDQPFQLYVILNHAKDKKIRTSRYEQAKKSRTKSQRSMVIVAVLICFVGFICQFVGLRALHWSATVTQLGTTLLMTCIRAWIRRGISNQPITFQLPDSDPDWIALSLGTACRNGWPPEKKPWPTKIAPRFEFCNALPEMRSEHITGLISSDDPRIQLRRKLQSSITNDPEHNSHVQTLVFNMGVLHASLRGRLEDRPFTWSHIVESSRLADSTLQYARLDLTDLFDYDRIYSGEQEIPIRNTLHALLSILRYKNSPPSCHRCVARVHSQEDWIRKRDFLVAHFPDRAIADRLSNSMSYLSTTGQLFRYNHGKMEPLSLEKTPRSFAGMSLAHAQPVTGPSSTGSNSTCGYLLVYERDLTITNITSELLAGFMDAVCQDKAPKYSIMKKGWYLENKGHRQWIDVDHIVSKLDDRQQILSKGSARLLILSSLARCTVWNDSVRTDEPAPESFPLPKPSSRLRSSYLWD